MFTFAADKRKNIMRINIRQLAKDAGIGIEEVSEHLFPTNKFPRLALNRVMQGTSSLNEVQISKFALMVGLEIGDLFTEGFGVVREREHEVVLETPEWKAILMRDVIETPEGDHFKDFKTRLLHKKSLHHEMVSHTADIPLSEYLELIEKIIYKNVRGLSPKAAK